MHITIAVMILLLAGCSSRPSRSGVSLTILDASTEWVDGIFFVFCEAALDNHTGTSITVDSEFQSVFDGLTLSVRDDSGRFLAQQAFSYHLSPSRMGRPAFMLSPGRNTNHMPFAFFELTNVPLNLRVQLWGTLPRSPYTAGVTSQVFRVTVREDLK